MGNSGSIVFSTELDLAPMKRDFTQAESIGKNGAAKVQNAIAKAMSVPINWGAISQRNQQSRASFPGLFPQSPRTFRPAKPGQYPSPASDEAGAGFSGNIGGLGRGLTLLLGARELANYYTKADEAAANLNQKVAQLTSVTGAGAFRGIAEMEANFKEVRSTLDEIRNRTLTETQGGARTPMMTLGHIVRGIRQFATGDSDEQEEQMKMRLRKQAVQDIDAMAGNQSALNEAESEALDGSERQSDILKEQISHREKLGRLAEAESAAGINNPAARNAENQRSKQSVEAIMRRFDLKKQEEEVENRLLNLHSSSLTKDQQSLVGLRERINLLKTRLSGPGSDEEKTRIGTQLHGLENQELNARYQEYLKPESQKQAERRSQEAYQRWVKDDARRMGLDNPHFDTQNRLIGGTDPMTRRHVEINPFQGPGSSATVSGPSSGNGTDAALVPLIQQLLTAFKDAWGK